MLKPLHSTRTGEYEPPGTVHETTLGGLVDGVRSVPADGRRHPGFEVGEGIRLWYAGDRSLVSRPCVAIVGARRVTADGAARARRLARALSEAGVVVISGLARGVDTQALTAAIDAGGRTIAVVGTPLAKAYPPENSPLQGQIYREHLLVSQFSSGSPVHRGNFPARNRLMAALSDATAIIEASDRSGTLHQASECTNLGRWLFIPRSVSQDPALTWPRRFRRYSRTRLLAQADDVLTVLR